MAITTKQTHRRLIGCREQVVLAGLTIGDETERELNLNLYVYLHEFTIANISQYLHYQCYN